LRKWYEYLPGPVVAAAGIAAVVITKSLVVLTGPALWWMA
jgi:hypothetical protein